jgi:hypothetical protein
MILLEAALHDQTMPSSKCNKFSPMLSSRDDSMQTSFQCCVASSETFKATNSVERRPGMLFISFQSDRSRERDQVESRWYHLETEDKQKKSKFCVVKDADEERKAKLPIIDFCDL